VQFKTYELLISRIFLLIVLDCGWLRVTETTESGAMNKRRTGGEKGRIVLQIIWMPNLHFSHTMPCRIIFYYLLIFTSCCYISIICHLVFCGIAQGWNPGIVRRWIWLMCINADPELWASLLVFIFSHSLVKCVLHSHYVPGTHLGIRDTVLNN
jgi:hypothetical protein